jgi:hypothetical protein
VVIARISKPEIVQEHGITKREGPAGPSLLCCLVSVHSCQIRCQNLGPLPAFRFSFPQGIAKKEAEYFVFPCFSSVYEGLSFVFSRLTDGQIRQRSSFLDKKTHMLYQYNKAYFITFTVESISAIGKGKPAERRWRKTTGLKPLKKAGQDSRVAGGLAYKSVCLRECLPEGFFCLSTKACSW